MNANLETAMIFFDHGSSALARFLVDEAGASTMEFLLVGSLAVTLLTLLVLAFDKALAVKAV